VPTPTNAPTSTLAGSSRTGGREVQNSQLFAELTERQAMPQTSQPIKGLAKSQRLILEKVGVVARIRLLITAKWTPVGEEEPINNPGMPWRLIKEIALQANGVTGIIDVAGVVLEQRRRRIYRNPVSAIFKLTTAVGTKYTKKAAQEAVFAVEIPIAHDMLSLIGALLAQNEETGLSLQLTWASEEELVNGGKIEKFEGEVEWASVVFSIGSTVIGKEEVTVLPDLSAFHGLVQTETPLGGTGQRKAELIRTAGQLLCYTASILNGAGGKEQSPPSEWTTFKLEYGGNKDPLVWTPAKELLEENADDYDGPLQIGTAAAASATNSLSFLAIDFERDNPGRDMVIPMSLTELRSVIGVPSGFAPSNAQILTTQETLYPAV
jgi:hypothetical protein